MKKKYIKPTITSFVVPIVNAQGFEIMGLCQGGSGVGFDVDGCDTGTLPDSTDGACGTGSSDSVEGTRCIAGSNASTECSTGGAQ